MLRQAQHDESHAIGHSELVEGLFYPFSLYFKRTYQNLPNLYDKSLAIGHPELVEELFYPFSLYFKRTYKNLPNLYDKSLAIVHPGLFYPFSLYFKRTYQNLPNLYDKSLAIGHPKLVEEQNYPTQIYHNIKTNNRKPSDTVHFLYECVHFLCRYTKTKHLYTLDIIILNTNGTINEIVIAIQKVRTHGNG